MPLPLYIETDFTATAAGRNSVIEMSDWLTVPFVLAAGSSEP